MGHLNGWEECMNNPEVTMHRTQQPTGFDALTKATEAAGIAISLVMRVPAPLKSIADQVIRSASSVPANLAEGHGRSGRDRIHHWRIAYASAKEVDIHLRLLIGTGAINSQRAESSIRLFDDVRAMTWRLIHPTT
jgi:four helix bundle protein